MPHTEFKSLSEDGLTLSYHEWTGSLAKPRAVIALVHGMGEHAGRYSHMARVFNEEGYAVLAFDLRGHGLSEGQRGHTPTYEALLKDISLLIKQALERFPGRPIILYGHSLGGNLVLNYALRYTAPLTGVIATSPWLRLAFEPSPFKLRLAGITNKLWPRFSQKNELDAEALAHDAAVTKAYTEDPLVHAFISARMFQSTHAAGLWALQNAGGFPLPLLLMHGTADRVTSFQASREFAAHIPGKCTFKAWDGLFHELHNEPQSSEVLAFISSWLADRLTPTT